MDTAELVFSYTDKTPLSELSNQRKSIKLSTDGFCIVLHNQEGSVRFLQRYSFDSSLTMEQKTAIVKERDQQLNIPCKEALFVLYTMLNTQIPQAFYHPQDNTIIGQFLSEEKDLHAIQHLIKPFDCQSLSFLTSKDYQSIVKNFPNYQLTTSICGLLNLCGQLPAEKKSLVFIDQNLFTIIAVSEKQKLLGANSFDYRTETDFTYFALAFLRQMFDSLEEVHLLFGGNLSTHSSISRSLSKFFRHFDFLKPAPQHACIENYYQYCDFLPLLTS